MPAMRTPSDVYPAQAVPAASLASAKRSRHLQTLLEGVDGIGGCGANRRTGQLHRTQGCGKVRMEMRIWNWFCSIFTWRRETQELVSALADSETALTTRVGELEKLVALQGAGMHEMFLQLSESCATTGRIQEGHFADLRAIVVQLGAQAKAKPGLAGNMADIRRFMGDVD
jgi:hypothetical protein